ncbi:MAG: tetratricopeptide repeat protein [Pseudomonadales bacterium]|nr:tetratricopeptide repeat protein [Pseudomonadales bacterium]
MASSTAAVTASRHFAAGPRMVVRWCLALMLLALGACASQGEQHLAPAELPPLHSGSRPLTVAEATRRAVTPDLLATNDAMRAFVQRYTGGINNSRQRLMALHRAIQGPGTLGIRYDPYADGSASEVFARGSANCLAYANLFVALAREAGLDARYQWLEVRPQWSRVGDRVQVGLHINVEVDLHTGSRYMVDIDPLPARDIAGTRELSDRDAAALYHSNIAMDALAGGDPDAAWPQAVRALQLAPDMPHLWVNIGAIYRQAGQYAVAERSYLQALALDDWQFSAMANLAVLYELQGREQERSQWLQRVEGYRRNNPYYYADLGDEAAAAGLWQEALGHYQRAVELQPDDSQLLFARSMIHFRLQDLPAAAADLRQAIEHATMRSDIDSYQAQLETLRQAGLAGTGD